MFHTHTIRIALITLLVIAATCISATVGATVIDFEAPAYTVGGALPADWYIPSGWGPVGVSAAGATSGSQSLALGLQGVARCSLDMAPVGVSTISVDVRPSAVNMKDVGYYYASYSLVSVLNQYGDPAGQVFFELYNRDWLVLFSPRGQSSWQIVGTWTLGTPYTVSFMEDYAANTLGISVSALGGSTPLISKTYNGASQLGAIWLTGNNYVPGGTMYVDNIRIGAVPEPSALAVLGTGVLGMLGMLRRKRA